MYTKDVFFFDRKWRFYGPKKRGQRHEVNEALKKGASCFRWISFFTMENKLLLISINYAPKIQPQLPKEMVRSNVFQVHQYLPALQQFFNDLSRLAINKIQERCEFRILWMISKKIQEPQQIPGIWCDLICDFLMVLQQKIWLVLQVLTEFFFRTTWRSPISRPSQVRHRPSQVRHRPSQVRHRPSQVRHRPSKDWRERRGVLVGGFGRKSFEAKHG